MAGMASMTLCDRFSDWDRSPFTGDSESTSLVWEATGWRELSSFSSSRPGPRRVPVGGHVDDALASIAGCSEQTCPSTCRR